jgi:hypothetical protein
MSRQKVQRSSFAHNFIAKKSNSGNHTSSWTNPYQQKNTQDAQQPASTIKPPTTEEWLKDNVLLRAIETRQTELQQQTIQAKLTVGEPGDKYEQEADMTASKVMSMPETAVQKASEESEEKVQTQPLAASIAPIAQMSAISEGDGKLPGNNLESQLNSSKGSGSPLSENVRSFMEPRFGADFSQVRVHTDSTAVQMSRELGAQAFTHGSDVYFGAGKSPGNNELTAHELTHVVQQTGAVSKKDQPIQRDTSTSSSTTGTPQSSADASSTPSTDQATTGASPLREKILQLFDKYDKKVVGDKEFDNIITEDAWNKQKKKEADYASDMEKYKKGELKEAPKLVAKYTTCIDTQRKILEEAFKNTGLSIEKVGKLRRYDFATLGEKNAMAIDPESWNEASAGMSKRPKPGDILILAKRGAKTDAAAKALDYVNNTKYGTAEKAKANDKAEKKLEQVQAAYDAAKAALEELANAVDASEKDQQKAEAALAKADKALQEATKKAEETAKALQESKDKAAKESPDYLKKLNDLRKQADHKKYFEFSHVGYLKSIDPKRNPDGTENWMTFDGGQTVQARGGKQGAESVKRIYNPEHNEISGEKSQGGEARWLQGWVDVDKLVQSPE